MRATRAGVRKRGRATAAAGLDEEGPVIKPGGPIAFAQNGKLAVFAAEVTGESMQGGSGNGHEGGSEGAAISLGAAE